jgi:predicted nuclease of predicted toxin-antitoxin system
VKFLLDQNLSRFLTGRLSDVFPGSLHVTEVGLDRSSDLEIWEWAGQNSCILVSKDSDFMDLATTHGVPPKTIWLQLGNASTDEVEEIMRRSVGEIRDFVESQEAAILIISGDKERG